MLSFLVWLAGLLLGSDPVCLVDLGCTFARLKLLLVAQLGFSAAVRMVSDSAIVGLGPRKRGLSGVVASLLFVGGETHREIIFGGAAVVTRERHVGQCLAH